MKPNGLKTSKKSSSEEHATRGVKKTMSAKDNKTVTQKKKSNSVKKASRILAVGLFTTQERSSCTISGSTNKSKEDKKRPQFDPTRMTLIHGNNYYTFN